MIYESLRKIYYKKPAEHKQIYSERFNLSLTRHFDFALQGRLNEFPAFFCYTEEFAVLSEQIYQKHEDLLRVLNDVPPLVLKQFILRCVVDEVRATSDIEGVHSTRKEIQDVVSGNANSPRFSSIVKKYTDLLKNPAQIQFQTCEDVRAFYDEFAHKEVASNNPNHALDGVLFRRDSVEITSPTGKIIHRGAYPESKIIEMLKSALAILNDNDTPLLARAAIFHYLFEYTHPFYDGNGRTGRFIVSQILSGRFNILVALRLSVLIKKNRKTYYELFKETDSDWNCGDLTPFVLGFTKIIAATLADVINLLNNKIAQLAKYRQKISALINGDALTHKIYESLLYSSVFFGSGISMSELIHMTGKARNTIKKRLNPRHVAKISTGNGKILYKLNAAFLAS